jgi:hypothetical protein
VSTPADVSRAPQGDEREWHGEYVRYDLVKEFAVALAVMAALAVILSILFSSPDVKPSTIKQWSRSDPGDFLTTAVGELDGSSGVATYGPPYNHASDGQKLGPLKLQKWAGAQEPINTARDFVTNPLRSVPGDPALQRAIAAYQAAPPAQQKQWTDAYTKALKDAKFTGATPQLSAGNYGPVASMMSSLLSLAGSGGLDGALLTGPQFYNTDYTQPLLFMSDGAVLEDRAKGEHLLGDQWGMMNETGSYPGQVWLWLYTFWYQIEPFKSSDNADALVWGVMALLTLAFVCIPFIPGLRSLPRHLGVHRLIWRDYYKRFER